MAELAVKTDVIRQLQKEVISMQRPGKLSAVNRQDINLGIIERSFPGQVFPTGTVHEFLSVEAEGAVATNGFIAGLAGQLLKRQGVCLWISTRRTIFPPALKALGVYPERIIFIDVARPLEALWIIEEALKCEALTAVVGEIKELGFTESRRLQLAVEQSRVTGFIHRHQPKTANTVACAAQWKIKPLPCLIEEGMPGLGFPRWQVQLVKVRNGKPGTWHVEWSGSQFNVVAKTVFSISRSHARQTG